MYCQTVYRCYSCYRLSAILGEAKVFSQLLRMTLTTCPLSLMCVGWGKYPNEIVWKLGWVRIMLQTPLLLVSLETRITCILLRNLRYYFTWHGIVLGQTNIMGYSQKEKGPIPISKLEKKEKKQWHYSLTLV